MTAESGAEVEQMESTNEWRPSALDAAEHAAIERPGCVVSYWLTGPAEAPLVTLSHAALTDHTFFSRMVPSLASRFRVLTWDIRGHGRSRPLRGALSIPEAADDLVAILDLLEVERAAMVGQSMGSYVAQELTFRHPERASALVVIGGTCITADPGPLGRALLAAAIPIARVWPFESLKRASVKASAEEQSSREYLRRTFDELTKHEYLKILDGVAASIHPKAGYATPVPTQLIVGELDGTGDIRQSMAAWAEREREVEYHVVGGAGHCANLDRPDEVNRLVLAFLERHLLRPREAAPGASTDGAETDE